MINLETAFKLDMPEPDVYHVNFEKQRDLAQSMMRLQEYYEGDEAVRGKYVTMEQFMHHFTKPGGEFLYTQIWAGFNVPGAVVEEWVALVKSKDGLTVKETQLMDAVFAERKKTKSKRWYLIGTCGEDPGKVLEHEIAHARYGLMEDYRSVCDMIVAGLPNRDRKRMEQGLRDLGYIEEVFQDEIQAYLSTSRSEELKDWFNLGKRSKPVIKAMRKLYRA